MASTLDHRNTHGPGLYELGHKPLKKTVKIADRHLFVTSRGSLEQLHADEKTSWMEEVDIVSRTITYKIIEIRSQPGNHHEATADQNDYGVSQIVL